MLTDFQTLRVAVLCSKRAPGLDVLLRHPLRGKLFEIACVVTTDSYLADQDWIEAAGVPVLVHPIRRFFDERKASLRDIRTRRAYDAETVNALQSLGVDTVLLLGYLYVLTDRMLDAFPARILNIHDSDLTIKTASGERRFVGLHSTRDAIIAGETETRSTVHFVTSRLDGGPVLMMGEAHPVAPFALQAASDGMIDVVRAYAYAHREWMMRSEWGVLATRALEYLASGVCMTGAIDASESFTWEDAEVVATL